MTRFMYENFCLIEGGIGAISIGLIVISCIRDVCESKAASEELSAAIKASQQLAHEKLNYEEVNKAMDIIRRRLRKD